MIDGTPRFLIVRLSSLGDVIHTMPAVAALRRRYPDARIDWLVNRGYVGLLELMIGLDERIAVDTHGPLGETFSTIAALRRNRYDAVVDLQGLLKSAVLARSAGARETVGFAGPQLREPIARPLYSRRVDASRAGHVIEQHLDVVATLGVTDRRVMFPIDVPRTPVADHVLEMFGRDDFALINPGASWPNKRWPPARFGQLAAWLRERRGLRSLIVWGPGEQGMAELVAAESHGAALLAPPTSIPDLFALSHRARLMISGDTGPLHIAGALGTPIVALFGPTLREKNGPWLAADVSVSRADRCSCLYERRCRLGTPCIEDIALAEVVAAVERRLDA